MKMFKKSALALALTAATGMAHAAGQIDISATGGPDTNGADQTFANILDGNAVDGSGPVFLDNLLASTSRNVDLSTLATVVREITYTPNTSIGENSTITFEMTNGAIDTANGVQLSDDNIGTAAVASLVDFTENANGYVTMRFQVESGVTLAAGTPYFLTTAAATTAATAVTIVTDAGLTTGDNVTIEATSAQDPSAIAISQGTAPAETLISVVDGIDVDVTVATSVINVEADPSRALFVDETAGEADTTTLTSIASLTFTNAAEIAPDFTGDDYTLSLTRANIAGVDSVDLLSATNQNLPLVDGSFVLNGANFDSVTGLAADTATDFVITVNGADVLETGNWTANLSVNDADVGGVGNVQLLNNAVTHQWDINGAQFKIPYHAQNASGFNFFFNAVNESANDAGVFADVIVENKSQNTRVSLTNVELGTALANGSTTFGQAAIKAAINAVAAGTINDEDVYHVAMTLTAIAPQNAVQVAAFQKDAVGRTVVPVYVNTNNPDDGRRWQQ